MNRNNGMVSDSDRSHITRSNIFNYFRVCKLKGVGYKLAGLITEKQMAFQTARGDLDLHWSMITKVCQQLFPKRDYEPGNLYSGAIEIYWL